MIKGNPSSTRPVMGALCELFRQASPLIQVVTVLLLAGLTGRQAVRADPMPGDPFMVDTSIIPIPLAGQYDTPSASFDGANYLVACNLTGAQGMYIARIGRDGTLLDPGGLAVGAGSRPAVSFGANEFLAVWQDDTLVRGARITGSGNVLDSGGFIIGHDPIGSPAVASDSSGFLVVFSTGDIIGMRVGADGQVTGDSIAISRAPNIQEAPDVVFDGSDYFVVWQDMRQGGYYDIYGARVTTTGVLLDSGGIPISRATYSQWHPKVACGSASALVVWEDYRSADRLDIYGARVDMAGCVLDTAGIPVATSAAYQEYPAICFGDGQYFVTWENYDGDSFSIHGARVSSDGVVLDSGGFTVAPTGSGAHALVWDATDFLMVWCDSAVRGTWITAAGSVVNPDGMALFYTAEDQIRPAVAGDSTGFLAVWQSGPTRVDTTGNIYGIRLGSDGTPLDARKFTLCARRRTQFFPAVSSGGNEWFAVWGDLRSDTACLYGTRVSRDGEVLDTAGIRVGKMRVASPSIPIAALASDGYDFLVVWNKYDSIYGARVDGSGRVLDSAGFPISRGIRRAMPDAAYDGANYLVVWQRNTTVGAIYAARVTTGGVVLDPGGVPVPDSFHYGSHPAVAGSGAQWFVVWSTDSAVNGARVTPGCVVIDTVPIRIAGLSGRGVVDVTFDGADYLVSYERAIGGDTDVYAAHVSTGGQVLDSFSMFAGAKSQVQPVLTRGAGGQILALASGWTTAWGGKPYGAMRIWGHLPPYTGINERSGSAWHSIRLTASPNPFRDKVAFSLSPAKAVQPVWIRIYDSSGRRVRKIRFSANARSAEWDGHDEAGRSAAAGVYVCRATGADGAALSVSAVVRQ